MVSVSGSSSSNTTTTANTTTATNPSNNPMHQSQSQSHSHYECNTWDPRLLNLIQWGWQEDPLARPTMAGMYSVCVCVWCVCMVCVGMYIGVFVVYV